MRAHVRAVTQAIAVAACFHVNLVWGVCVCGLDVLAHLTHVRHLVLAQRPLTPRRARTHASPAHSYLAKILVEDGDVAKVGSTVALIAATQ